MSRTCWRCGQSEHGSIACAAALLLDPKRSLSPEQPWRQGEIDELHARIAELERELDVERKDWSKLCLAIANALDPECADAMWQDIWEAFSPYTCLADAKKREQALLARAEAAEKALGELRAVPQKPSAAGDVCPSCGGDPCPRCLGAGRVYGGGSEEEPHAG